MPRITVNDLALLFKTEWLMLWRNDLGNPKWNRLIKPLLIIYISITVTYGVYSYFSNLSFDNRGIIVIGFIIALGMFSSYKALQMLSNKTNTYSLILTPLPHYIYLVSKLVSHWIYCSSMALLLTIPSILSLVVRGYPEFVVSIVMVYIIGIPFTCISWMFISIISSQWGVETARFFIKSAGFIISLVMTLIAFTNPDLVARTALWWGDRLQLLYVFLSCLCSGLMLAIIAPKMMCTAMLNIKNEWFQSYSRGRTHLASEGFTALLLKEYRLLIRVLRKAIIFIIANYAISSIMVWFMFQVLNPNEAYFYVSLMMFIFAIYIAGPSNILTACEDKIAFVLRISPTSIGKILLAKTIAVFTIMGPLSVLAGYFMIYFFYEGSTPLLVILLTGLGVGIITIWNGALETMIRMIGLSYKDMFIVSIISLIASLIAVVSSYYIQSIPLMMYVCFLILSVFFYFIAFIIGIKKIHSVV